MPSATRVANATDFKGSLVFAAVAVTGGMVLVLLGLLRQLL